jgi:tetratricopeptide (TPR) repeat protein
MILSFQAMKRTGILVSAFLFTGLVSGQSVLDCLLKAKALTGAGKPDQSVQIISEAIDKHQDNRLFLERAEAYLAKGDYQKAIEDFNSANLIAGQSGEYGLAKSYALKGDGATSLYHLEMTMKSPFKRSEKEIMLDPAFRRIEGRPEWRQFWKEEWYSIPEKSLSEIEYYTSSGKIESASAILGDLEKNYPGDETVQYAGSLVNLFAGRSAAAIKMLTGLLASDPDNEKYLKLLARAQVTSSNPAGASMTYSKLINMDVPDADLFIKRAECYGKTGETVKALDDIEKYLSLYPEDKAALGMAGKIEALSGDNIKALAHFSENLRIHPNDPECYLDRANSYFSARSWEWAIKDYSMALDLEPANADTWLNKGIALLNSGKKDDACFDFRKSFSLGNKRATDYISKYCIK